MIADRYLQLKGELENALGALIKLGSEMQRPSEELNTLQALARDINEPLLFVVVGEVKSGKSSLINALFGQEFAKVDVLPTTDRVYIFRYGANEKSMEVSARLTERYLPIPFLRDFNIVDTPGTNTMVTEHQMVAEEFMPRADIVLFVFSVANPWTQSNWGFLSVLQEKWLKNVIFVLQQIDLREPTEIDVIFRHLQDTAMRKLGFVPPIFAVSARKALLSRAGGANDEQLWTQSAFAPLEEQINLIVTESSTRMLKLRSTFQAARVAVEDLLGQTRAALEAVSRDETVLGRADQLIQGRRDQMRRQVGALVHDLENAYQQNDNERAQIFRHSLTWPRTVKLVWSQAAWRRDFEGEIAGKLQELLKPQIEKAVGDLEKDLRAVWPQIQDVLENGLSAELHKEQARIRPDFVRQRGELMNSIETALGETLAGEAVHKEIALSVRQTSAWMRIAGLVALVAAGLAAFFWTRQPTVAFSALATAVLATGVGILAAFNHNRNIARSYERQLDPKGTGFAKALERSFAEAIDRFFDEISKPIQMLSASCQTEREKYEPWAERGNELEQKFADLKSRVG